MRKFIVAIFSVLAISGCRDDRVENLPPPATMTADALGHYCQMNLSEHPGPKAQIHLSGMANPVFFSQVRDAIAYQRMPEQSHRIEIVYVSDMAVAPSWDNPGEDNWIRADDAFYVIGSAVIGGMAAPELVPFSDKAKAEEFTTHRGGRVVSLKEIDDEDVLAPVDQSPADGDDADFRERLKSLSTERSS